ncbi:MAG TPA: iron-containing redox enzyme family protein [Candidatus Binataceae bacterium]|nr:iron-containing redox enzyme family protein [Candidatus Binataceae bacterium]
MALSVEATLQKVREIHKRRQFQDHPLWVGLLEGTFTRPQVCEFARQFGIVPLHNHNYHGRLYVICPDPKWREMIAEVCYEEATGRLFAKGVPHHQLYLNFGAGLGLDRDQMMNPVYGAGALAFKSYFIQMCGSSFLEGVAAHMLAGEAQGPGVFSRLARTLQQRFGLSEKAVDFWTVHDVADEEHSSIGDRLLNEFAPTEADRRRVIEVVEGTVGITFLLYDDIYSRLQAIG